MDEKTRLEQRLSKDYGIEVKFSEEIDSTDDVYVQICAEDGDVPSCTESGSDDHDLKLRVDGYYGCQKCARIFEKLNRNKSREAN